MQKRYLYLMRHGAAESAGGGLDFGRALSRLGKKQIEAQKKCFASRDGIRPDVIFYSTAKRTRETAETLKTLFKGIPFFCRETLYLAPTYRLLDLIQNTDDIFYRLLIIGHNPGLEQLAEVLSRDKVRISLAPADCVSIRMDIESWCKIAPGTGKIEKIYGQSI